MILLVVSTTLRVVAVVSVVAVFGCFESSELFVVRYGDTKCIVFCPSTLSNVNITSRFEVVRGGPGPLLITCTIPIRPSSKDIRIYIMFVVVFL
eukprot:UN00013